MEQEQSLVCSKLLENISYSLPFSEAVYEPSLQLTFQLLSNKIPGGIKILHHQGFSEPPDEKARSDHQQVLVVARLETSHHLVVACRGTSTFGDVLQDLKCLPTKLSFSGGYTAHWGFAERAESIPLDSLQKFMREFPDSSIIFTGHSLGGAVASLLALRLLQELDSDSARRVKCITFGAPLFASSSLAALVAARYRAVFFHVALRGDCVPKLLPFVSAAQRLVYDDDHWEGFRVSCMAVGSLLPFFSGILKGWPGWVLGMILRMVIPRSLSYDYAGQVLVLDKDASSLSVFGSERFNAWHSRVAMALGGGKDAVMRTNDHSIYSYERAIANAVSLPIESRCMRSVCDEDCHYTFTEVEVIGWHALIGKVLGVLGRISRNFHAVRAVCVYTFACRIARSLFHRLLVVERAPIPFLRIFKASEVFYNQDSSFPGDRLRQATRITSSSRLAATAKSKKEKNRLV